MQFVSHPWVNPNTIEKRHYQEAIVRTAVSGNTLVVIPTGLGKTSVAALVAAHRLGTYPDGKIMFLAPTRPLVEQHRTTFERCMKIGPSELKTITGHNEPEERAELYRRADAVFSTPQTIRNDLKMSKLNLKDFSLLVIDEAHRAVGDYAYAYVARAYMNSAANPLILALTASPGSVKYKIEEVKKHLSIQNIEIRTRDDQDVRPYVQQLDQTIETVELPVPFKSIRDYLEKIKSERMKKLVDWKIVHSYRLTKTEIIRLQNELAEKKTGMGYASMSLLAEILKVDHAQTLLETQCLYSLKKYFDGLANQQTKAVARLFKDENFRNAMRLTTELINEDVEHPKIEALKRIVSTTIHEHKDARIIVFVQFRDTIAKVHDELTTVPHAAPIEFIGQAKKKGKGLSQKEQVQILNEFKMGFHNVLIASQIGEEGLDIEETDTVIFYEPTPSAIRKIQRSGRTARTKPGKVIMLMTKDTRDEAYHWSGYRKERNMTRMLYTMQAKQKALGDY